MALRKTIIEDIKFVGPTSLTAYIKVMTTSGTKDKQTANVVFYHEPDMKIITNKTYEFDVDLSGSNFIAQAYVHIKSLPEFANAEDC